PGRLPRRARQRRLHHPHPTLSRMRHAHEGAAPHSRVYRQPPAAARKRAGAPQAAPATHIPRDQSRMGVEPLILVSSNPNKGIEVERILGVPLLRVSISLPEIQAPTVEDITRYKLEVARTKGYHRLIVEDVSLGFDELGNFPGPYVKWLLEAAGGKGL